MKLSVCISSLPGKDQEMLAHYQLNQNEVVTIGELIAKIREYHQMDMYTVDPYWCVQLFHRDDNANDDVDCIYENHREELIDVLFVCLRWIYECPVD